MMILMRWTPSRSIVFDGVSWFLGQTKHQLAQYLPLYM